MEKSSSPNVENSSPLPRNLPVVNETKPIVFDDNHGYGLPMFYSNKRAILLKVLKCAIVIAQVGWIYSVAFDYISSSRCLNNCDAFYFQAANESANSTLTKGHEQDFPVFRHCVINCYRVVLPSVLPLFLCILRACFTFRMLLKDTYEKARQVVELKFYFLIDSLALVATIICLLYMVINNKEGSAIMPDGNVNPVVYHVNYGALTNAIQILALIFTAITMVLHIFDIMNRRWPFKEDFVYIENQDVLDPVYQLRWCFKCLDPGILPRVMKVTHCTISIGIVLFVTFLSFGLMYSPDNVYIWGYDTYEGRTHFLVPIHVSMAMTHAIGCFIFLPSSNRYKRYWLPKVLFSFYFIETFLLFSMAVMSWAIFSALNVPVALAYLAELSFWVTDFSQHHFPNVFRCF